MKNLSISKKLMIVFSIIIIISAMNSMFLIHNANNAYSEVDNISGNLTERIVEFSTAYEYMLAMDGMGVKHFLTNDAETKKKFGNNVVNCNETLENSLNYLLKVTTDPKEHDTIAQIQEQAQQYYSMMEKALDLSNNGRGDEAFQMLTNDMTPISLKIFAELRDMDTKLQNQVKTTVKDVNSESKKVSVMVIIFEAVYLAVIIGTIMLCHRFILKPVKKANKELDSMTHLLKEHRGDLSQRLTVSSKDEIGQLVMGVNRFITELEQVIQKINGVAEGFNHSFTTYDQKIVDLLSNVEDNSASIEEMSAGMEEASSSVQEIGGSTDQVGELIMDISEKAGKGATLASTISERADVLMDTSVKAQNDAKVMLDEIGESLKDTIEKSKEVDKINALTDNILDITSQTNLLALNASIEAARAGEMGKGFAVVAEEIGHLAEGSRKTANQIQTLSNSVVGAVEGLSNNASRILEFVNGQVMNDYVTMVENGKQYNKDAASVDAIMKEFDQMAVSLNASMSKIVSSVDGVKNVIVESSKAANNVSENSTDLLMNVDTIKEQLSLNKESIKVLYDLMKQFEQQEA